MTHDPLLKELFDEARQDLDGEAFTGEVLNGTRRFKRKLAVAAAGVLVGLLACVWIFALPLQEFGLMLVRGLMTPLLVLEDGWLAWVTAPLNTVGSLLVVLAKLSRMAWKRFAGAFYVS